MELIVQKCTELGVDAIQPVRMTRCVPEPERNPEKNLARLNRVAREAAKLVLLDDDLREQVLCRANIVARECAAAVAPYLRVQS